MTKKLTIKQQEFAKEYVENNGNGTQAALAVYDTCDEPTAGAIASENLRKPIIVDAIQSIQEKSRNYLDAQITSSGIIATTIDRLRKIMNDSDPLIALQAADRLTAFLKLVQTDSSQQFIDNRKAVFNYPKTK